MTREDVYCIILEDVLHGLPRRKEEIDEALQYAIDLINNSSDYQFYRSIRDGLNDLRAKVRKIDDQIGETFEKIERYESEKE